MKDVNIMRSSKLASRTALAVAASMVAIGTWSASAVAAPARPAPATLGTKAVPGLENCGLGPVLVKPKTVVLSCADANSMGKDLVWSKWAAGGAKATGIFTWNVCKPYCAASKTWAKSTATYTLGDLVHTSKYGWLFEELTVHITGKKTGGFPRTMTYPQKPVK